MSSRGTHPRLPFTGMARITIDYVNGDQIEMDVGNTADVLIEQNSATGEITIHITGKVLRHSGSKRDLPVPPLP